jgi:hypothetical protein
MIRPTALALLLLAALASPAPGQSMGEAARREQERRAKTAKKPAPAYTDEDLAARRPKGTEAEKTAESPSPSASPAPDGSPTPPPPAEDEAAILKQQEADWRARFEAARELVRQAEAAGWRVRVETVFVNGIPVQQSVRKYEETPELRQAKQDLEILEEAFRRTGLPAGWAR